MLIQELREHLIDTMIPFWSSLMDRQYGGYYSHMDYDLNIDKEGAKGCILNSRILWFFSNAYQLFKTEELKVQADHAYAFLKEHCLDREYGGIYWSLGYDGIAMDETKHTYNQAFGIYALSSYYRISKDEEVIKMAWDLYDLIEQKCRDEYGYMEAFDRYFQPVSNEKLSENGVLAEKTMNTLLHIMEAYSELYHVTLDVRVADRLVWIMDTIAEKVFNQKDQRQEVFFDRHWNRLIDLHSYGHDIEAAWLIDRGCEVLGNQELTKRMGHITRTLTKKIYDRAFKNQSLLNECENGIDNTVRVWWVQAEGMVGFMNGYQKTAKKEYLLAVCEIWSYIKENLIDKRSHSEWYWEVDENGIPSSRKPIVEPWKCPYHNGRMCIEIIRRNVDAT